MKSLIKEQIAVPGYRTALPYKAMQEAIHEVKARFERKLAEALNLVRVAAPLFVRSGTGVNDNLNGTERPVVFHSASVPDGELEIVHSLAKWKRWTLGRHGFGPGEGLFACMNAIRKDEELDNLHSLYVDQWDWELTIGKEQRTEDTLRRTVEAIYGAIRETERYVCERHSHLKPILPEQVEFLTSQELEDRYPALSPNDRENELARRSGAAFVMQIGGKLRSGIAHDGRSPDYDDWMLNGDLIVWNPVIGRAFELSSMGIRVDEEALLRQLKLAGCEERRNLDFHKAVLERRLPYSIGGGIGQSRLCMLLLGTAHIAEVQASVWPERMEEEYRNGQVAFL